MDFYGVPFLSPNLWKFYYRAVFQMLLSVIPEASSVQAKFLINFSTLRSPSHTGINISSYFNHGRAQIRVSVICDGFSLSWSLRQRASLLLPWALEQSSSTSAFIVGLPLPRSWTEAGPAHFSASSSLSCAQGHAFCHLWVFNPQSLAYVLYPNQFTSQVSLSLFIEGRGWIFIANYALF